MSIEETRLRAVESASYALTAALAQMAPGYEAGEAEYLSRESVMELVMKWRMAVDAAHKAAKQFHHQGGV